MRKVVSLKFIFISFIFTWASYGQTLPVPSPTVVNNQDGRHYTVVYPVGWSGEGRFGFIWQNTNRLDEEIYSYQLIVQNMVTDSILYQRELSYDFNDCQDCRKKYAHIINADTMAYHPTFFRKVVWPNFKQEVMSQLINHQIVPHNPEFTAITNGFKEFPLKLVEKRLFTSDRADCITEYSLKAKWKEKEKVVHVSQHKCEEGSTNDYKIAGYFKSILEERTALVIFEQGETTEGFHVKPMLVGIHLFKGFD